MLPLFSKDRATYLSRESQNQVWFHRHTIFFFCFLLQQPFTNSFRFTIFFTIHSAKLYRGSLALQTDLLYTGCWRFCTSQSSIIVLGACKGFLVIQVLQITQVVNLHTLGLVAPTTGTGTRLDNPIIHSIRLLEHVEQELKVLTCFTAAIPSLFQLLGFLGSDQPIRKIHLTLIEKL